jgi:hypothetical protein
MLRASCLLTYRESGSAERRENLLAVMRWLSGHRDVEIVVVEQDAAPTLDASLAPAGGRVVFARNPGLFNKGWGLNVAARQSTAPVLAICDADVIAPGFEAALERCLADTEAVKPYKSIVDLTAEESTRVRAGEWDFAPQRPPNAPPDRQAIGEIVNFGGGLFLIRRELFGRLGGFDERFRGWGGEDDAMALKIARSGARRAELGERPALHLFHPRPHEATFGQPNYEANRALLAECAAYSPAEYRRVCEVGRQIAGNPEKYRAAP